MLRKYIAAICASSLAAGAVSAAVLPVPANSQFYISGSTALNNQLYADILQNGGICQGGTINVYIDSTLAGGGVPKAHQVAIACNLSQALGTLAIGAAVAWVKESNGGSNEGTNNVANGIALTFLNANVAPAGCAGGQAIAAGAVYAHQQAFTEFDSCTNTAAIVPTIGLADENPQLFNVGQDAISPAAIAKLNSETMFQNGFGIAVSLNLYRALQRQQGLALTDTLATMPTLSRQQISGLYTGGIDWSGVGDAAGVAINAPVYDPAPSAPNQVFLCRRGDTSGTNASADVFFLRNRCSAQRFPMLAAATTVANCGGLPGGQTPTNFGCKWAAVNLPDTTFAGTGGGDVVSCIHAHDKANQFAIGALGATSKFDDAGGLGGSGDAVGSSHFRYVAIDGAKPTVISQANGTYTYVMDNVINTLKTLGGNALAASNFIQLSLTSAVPLADTFVAQPGGDANYVTGGILDAQNPNSLAPAGAPVNLAGVTANPVSPLTMSPSGAVDDCQAPIPVTVIQTVQQ